MAQTLDFGTVTASENVRTLADQYPHAVLANGLIVPGIVLILVFCIWVIFQKLDDRIGLPTTLRLAQLPISAKAAITVVWLGYGLVHLFSVLTVYLKTSVAYQSAQEYFFYMPVHKLAALSHAHFFGHATMYALCTSLFLLTSLPERPKRIIVLLAPVGAILDNASWWGMKLASPGYEILSYFSGTLMVTGFSVMAIISFIQMWRSNNDSIR
ncbi:MAG: hypothetical protein AAB066_02540 [Candidatus Margulisiibacteriota bacterium]